jgi:hypothetical protein
MNQPVRSYPLRTVNEPSVYVTGEKAGAKVYPPGGPQMHGGPGGSSSMPPTTIGLSMNLNQQQAMISQQNNAMESLERRRERERERERVRDRTGSTAGVRTLSKPIGQQTADSVIAAPTARRRRRFRR